MKPIVVPDYHLIVKCGRGAYGDVYVAKSLSGSLVALKIIEKNTHAAKEFEGLKFYCSRCGNSPYLIQIFHTGETESFFYYTMELADNLGDENNYVPATLANYLVDNKRLPIRMVRNLALNLLSGLETLHSAGLVHRDIKPENIIFVNKMPKLSDIGLVSSVSAAFSLGGTLGFIPPEKLKSSSGNTKSATDDLYALGKLIYCVFTGNPPDKFPSIPQDIILDEEAKRLNEVTLIACSKVSHLRFHSIDKFRKALITSISKKRKTFNFIWTHRYYWLIGIMLYLSFAMVLRLVTNRPGSAVDDDKFETSRQLASPAKKGVAAYGNSSDTYNDFTPGTMRAVMNANNISPQNKLVPINSYEFQNPAQKLSLPAIGTSYNEDLTLVRNEVVQKMADAAIIPPVISDFEFKELMNQQLDNHLFAADVLKVEYYLLKKGSKRFADLQEEIAKYLASLAAIETLMFKLMPDKVVEIKTTVRNCADIMSVPSALSTLLSPDMWKNKKMYRSFYNCAIRAENIKVIFMEKRGLLSEAMEWDKYVLAARWKNRQSSQLIYFNNLLGKKNTDFEKVLETYKNSLRNSSEEKKEYNQQCTVRFLENLKSCISTPEIADLEVKLLPLELRLAAARAIRVFAQKNVDDYVVSKYGINVRALEELDVQNYKQIKKRIRDSISHLPEVQQQLVWTQNKEKELNALREKELANTSNPQVAAYLKARHVLAPYLNDCLPAKEIRSE